MADTVIGRVTYVADVDGKVAIAESYLIGGKMADAMEKGFIQKSSLQKSMKAISGSLSDAGKDMVAVSVKSRKLSQEVIDLGHVVASSGEKWEASGRQGMLALESLSSVLDKNKDSIRANIVEIEGFKKAFVVSGDGVVKFGSRLDALKAQFQRFGDNAKGALGNVGSSFKRAFSSGGLDRLNTRLQSGTTSITKFVRSVHTSLAPIRAMNKGVKDLTGGFRRLGPGMRRFIFYAVLFTAIMPELAALSSGASGGLVILAGALAVLVAGIAVAVIAFTGLLGDIEKLNPALLPAREALDGLKETFKGLRDAMTIAAAPAFVELFDNLKATIDGLSPVISQFAAIAVGAFAKLSEGLLPGTDGFKLLQSVITAMGPIFESLIGILGPLGSILGQIFILAAPYIQQFAVYLTDILTKFSEWIGLNPTAVTDWLDQASLILGAVAQLAGDLGLALAEIVTPQVVASLVSFLDQLGAFLSPVAALLSVVEDLQIFGILGAIFDALGPIFTSLAEPMGEFASILGGAIIDAIETLGPILLTLLEAFAPLLPILGELVASLLPPIVGVFNALVEAVVPLIEPLLAIVNALLTMFMPLLEPLYGLVEALVGVLGDQLLVAFQAISGVLVALAPIITIIAELVGALISTLVALITGDFSAIPEIWGDAWEGMMEAVQTMVDFVKPIWDGIVGFIEEAAANMGSFIGTQLYMIRTGWEAVWNGISSFMKGIWNGILGFIEGGINGTVDLINGLLKGINAIGGAIGIGKINLLPKVHIPRFATGGIVGSSTFAQIGEAGPEMVVPLRRPLGQIPDQRVRDVAAYAQGKSTGRDGKSVVFNEGAIQVVTPARNPVLVANMVVDRITEDALN